MASPWPPEPWEPWSLPAAEEPRPSEAEPGGGLSPQKPGRAVVSSGTGTAAASPLPPTVPRIETPTDIQRRTLPVDTVNCPAQTWRRKLRQIQRHYLRDAPTPTP